MTNIYFKTYYSFGVFALSHSSITHKVMVVYVTVSDTGSVVYSEVRSFLHRETGPTAHAQYITLETEDGKTISLSKSHLIFAASVNTTEYIMPRLYYFYS